MKEGVVVVFIYHSCSKIRVRSLTSLHAVNTVKVTLKTKQNLRNPNCFKDHLYSVTKYYLNPSENV